jgi:hypothetical protein
LFTELRRLQTRHPEAAEISGNLAYLQKREQQIQYPRFQVEAWPIGSGIVESGNKLVVEARLKGSGMHWVDQLSMRCSPLRNIVRSGRWKEDWPKVELRLRQEAAQKRQKLHQSWEKPAPPHRSTSRRGAFLATSKIFLLTPPNPKDSKDNHWRKFKYGHGLYQRDDSLKK